MDIETDSETALLIYLQIVAQLNVRCSIYVTSTSLNISLFSQYPPVRNRNWRNRHLISGVTAVNHGCSACAQASIVGELTQAEGRVPLSGHQCLLLQMKSLTTLQITPREEHKLAVSV